MTNEQNDKQFQDWIRQSLENFQPEGNLEKDWGKFFPKAEKKPFIIWRFLGGIGLGVCFIIGVLFYLKDTDNQVVASKKQVIDYPINGLKIESFPSKFSEKIISKKQNIAIVEKKDFITPKENSEIIIEADIFKNRRIERNLTLIEPTSTLVLLTNQTIKIPPIQYLSPEENEIKYQMLLGEFGEDSTTYQSLSRNIRQWQNAVIVSDFTTSMYPYSTQIFAWMKKNARHLNIKGTVFFTDCDSLGNQIENGKSTGQMFLTKEKNPLFVVPMMLNAARNTQNNRDSEENDLEALLYAQANFPNTKHLVLIADNDAPPKDMYLLSKIKKPVHVVLCGTTRDATQAFQEEYLEIAQQTKGSLHTLEDDINPNDLDKNTWIKVGKYYYHYRPRLQQFRVTTFKHRPRKIFGFLWL